MIYVCIPSHNEAATVGLLLWKIRQVFAGFPREYQLLVLDDGSTDATSEVLEPYSRVLPLTLVHHAERRGYAASVQELFRVAIELTDRPKRDAAILMHADFTHNPQVIPDLVRRIESGADLVVAEGTLEGEPSRPHRMLRRFAPQLLRGAVAVPGVHDVVSGFAIVRLVALRNAMRSHAERVPPHRRLGRKRGAVLANRALRAPGGVGALCRAARFAATSQPAPAGGGGAEPLAGTVHVPRHADRAAGGTGHS